MKKLLILSNSTSGLYDFRNELISLLIKNDYSVTAYNPEEDKAEELEKLGCRTVTLSMDRRSINPLKDLVLAGRYFKVIKAEKPDLIMTYTIKPNIYGGLMARLCGIKYAANITGLGSAFEKDSLVRRIASALYKKALKRVKVVFFENTGDREYFVNEGIIDRDRTVVLSGAGVNLDRFGYLEYPEDRGSFNFLFVGRIMREKGVDELFEAVKKLRSEGYDLKLSVLGYYEENYEDAINSGTKEGWLSYYGYQPDVRPFIAESHCFVLPSWHEGMANTNLECASSGRPVITSNIPGCMEAVTDGETGFLCEVKNTDSLTDAMRRMMKLSNAERAAMGRAGRSHMAECFDKNDVINKTLSELER